VPQDAVVAVCGVERTVVDPAPRGAFAVHDLIYDWAAHEALEYYTGRSATFVLSGDVLGERPCRGPEGADRVIAFTDLEANWRADG
jgi:hypothetical protein